jgi:predicted DNA-binding transcriptional regulator YafY
MSGVPQTWVRLLDLLSLLQARRDWTGSELAEQLGVTTRTVRNDIEQLRQLGYRIDASPGVAGGYRSGPGAVVPPLLLDDEEAVAITLGLRMAATGGVAGIEDAAVRALTKMSTFLPSRLRRQVSAFEAYVVSASASEEQVEADVLVVLSGACRDEQQVRFDYRRPDGVVHRRNVEPYRLVFANQRWYLLAWDLQRRDWRTFRVERLSFPVNHLGPHFHARTLPHADAASYVLEAIHAPVARYQCSVIAHATAHEIRPRLPPAVAVEPVGAERSRVFAGADSAEQLSHYLGMLGVDFEIEDPASHQELVAQLRSLAGRLGRAASTNR